LAPDAELLQLTQETTTDNFDLGLSRINQENTSGYGYIGKVAMVIMENLEGKTFVPFEIRITNVKAIDKDGKLIALNTEPQIVDVVSSVENTPRPLEAKVYPNPVNDLLFIETEQIADLKIFDSQGQLVKTAYGIRNEAISVADLSPGFYLLNMESDTKTTQKKLIVNR